MQSFWQTKDRMRNEKPIVDRREKRGACYQILKA